MMTAVEFMSALENAKRTGKPPHELIETRDAEWQARVDAAHALTAVIEIGLHGQVDTARREGWEAGVRAALDIHQEHPPSEHYEASKDIEALIAQGPK